MASEQGFDYPTIDPGIWRLRPDFVALSIVVRGGRNAPSSEVDSNSQPDTVLPPATHWADAHLEAWRAAYRAFGAKPKRTPSSAEALQRRVQRDGTLPCINAIVDAYNALSVQYALPIGGEDMAAYVGPPRLVRAAGDEPFETMRDGELHIETAEPGEVIWRDDRGVTCRRWNWRQSTRTQLTIATTEMWFVLERLEPFPLEKLEEAGASLVRAVRQLAPDASITTRLLAKT